MKPSAEGPTNSALFPDYGYSQPMSKSLSGSQTSSYTDLIHSTQAPYVPASYANLVSEHYTAGFTFGRRQIEIGSSSYPESSQRTSICGAGDPYSSSYGAVQDVQLDDTRSLPGALHSTSLESDLDQMPPIMSSSMRHQSPCMQQDSYHGSPSDAAASPDRRLLSELGCSSTQNALPYYIKDTPERLQPPPLLFRRDPSPEVINFQLRFNSPSQSDFGGGADHISYCNLEQHRLHNLPATLHSPDQFSIPMRSDTGWSSASPLGSTFHVTHDSDSPLSSFSLPELGDHVNADPTASSSSEPGPSNPPIKKKKAKMHDCEVCGKKFPRPSGLKTHMNTHNNLKPFPCGFAGCPRTFTVRSNAKRHLRTHGVDPSASRATAKTPYVVGFSTPTIMHPPATTTHEVNKLPYKLRWMPPSLSSRTNVHGLLSLSDDDSESEDWQDEAESNGRSALSIPFPPVVPSSSQHDSHDRFEERNSYADAPLYPYHPSQFRILPGPAVLSPQPNAE